MHVLIPWLSIDYVQIQDITYLDLPELSDLKPSSDEVLEALIIRSSATEDEPFLRATKELRAEDIEAGIVSRNQYNLKSLIIIFTLTATWHWVICTETT